MSEPIMSDPSISERSASEHRGSESFEVEVAFAKPDDYRILSVQVDDGTTVLDAAKKSGISDVYPEIDWETVKVGIFGKAVPKAMVQTVKEGDRIEVYRPLIADPKEVRKRRAEQAKKKKEAEAG
ncbi:RnfH family protein [Endozoicomonas sp. OPT23]|uniref:RnfH family protein n=1 Tax=Endozoicomonas sp. OPT23 TaxID=2072845 RepID=UPI00129B38E8|nr:RnfH family protein [Endozoicomonas sp. OPT23]MRI32677.1 RnfH family protein [Endozoicomonas sp. OPT23]